MFSDKIQSWCILQKRLDFIYWAKKSNTNNSLIKKWIVIKSSHVWRGGNCRIHSSGITPICEGIRLDCSGWQSSGWNSIKDGLHSWPSWKYPGWVPRQFWGMTHGNRANGVFICMGHCCIMGYPGVAMPGQTYAWESGTVEHKCHARLHRGHNGKSHLWRGIVECWRSPRVVSRSRENMR